MYYYRSRAAKNTVDQMYLYLILGVGQPRIQANRIEKEYGYNRSGIANAATEYLNLWQIFCATKIPKVTRIEFL